MPMESTVGTFRITQPGSSVATSLTTGESERKQVGILDIRGNDFRLRPIPLSQVRAFVASEVSLSSFKEEELDPEDPNVDEVMKDLLHLRVEELIEEAREQARTLQEDADEEAKRAIPGVQVPPRNYAVQKPDQVLVRLKVEHSGFTTLNNQRFGAKFVNDVVSFGEIPPNVVCSCSPWHSYFRLILYTLPWIYIHSIPRIISCSIGQPGRYSPFPPPSSDRDGQGRC